jgi:hypothetical protein
VNEKKAAEFQWRRKAAAKLSSDKSEAHQQDGSIDWINQEIQEEEQKLEKLHCPSKAETNSKIQL